MCWKVLLLLVGSNVKGDAGQPGQSELQRRDSWKTRSASWRRKRTDAVEKEAQDAEQTVTILQHQVEDLEENLNAIVNLQNQTGDLQNKFDPREQTRRGKLRTNGRSTEHQLKKVISRRMK